MFILKILKDSRYSLFILMILSSFWITSCKKDGQSNETGNNNTIGQGGMNVINVNMSVADFEDEPVPKSRATSSLNSGAKVGAIKSQKIALANGSTLVAELSETSPLQKTEAITKPLDIGIVYRVVVYENKAKGKYIKQKDYTRGKESTDATPLQLDEGTYTFIVHAIAGNTDAKNLLKTDPARTLDQSFLNFEDGIANNDILWFRTDMKVVSSIGTTGKTNFLNVVLKHVFCQVITTIDVSATGFSISGNPGTALTFTKHFGKSAFFFDDGRVDFFDKEQNPITTMLSKTSSVVTFATLINGATDLNKIPATGLSNVTIPAFNLSSSQIGPFVFKDVKITRGVRHNLKITVNPMDFFLSWQGQPAAAIGGQVWMRYNLGVNQIANSNPDVTTLPISKQLVGNYYRWAIKDETATPLSTVGVPVGEPRVGDSWNAGTEDNPLKAETSPNITDPCPKGYRMPTKSDYNNLMANTTNTSTNNVIQFLSKKLSGVKLTFLPGGWYNDEGKTVSDYGGTCYYWTSTTDGGKAILLRNAGFDTRTRYDSNTVRCIAEDPKTAMATGTRQ